MGISVRGALLATIVIVLGAGCGSPIVSRTRDDEGSVPAPRPASTGDYQVGAYYFPGWPVREKWRQLDAFPERMPLLGYYAEGDPAARVDLPYPRTSTRYTS